MVKPALTLEVPDLSGRFAVVTGANTHSVLTVLDVYREPMPVVAGSPVPGAQFQSAVEHSGRAIPHVTQQLIGKYLAELDRLGVLTK